MYTVWLAGSLVSQLGDAALYFGLGWAASAIGGSAAGLVLSTIAATRMLLLLVGGVVGDRAGARRVMVAGDAVMLVVAIALAVVSRWWGTPLPLLVLAALVIGTVDAFYLPALGSMPRRLVGDAALTRAVATRQSATQLVTLIGAPIGGALVVIAGLSGAALADAVSFAIVLVVLLLISRRFSAPASRKESVLRSAIDGIRVAFLTPGLMAVLLLAAGAAGCIIPATSLLVPLLARENHWSAAEAGLIIGAQGLGVISATLVAARRGSARRPGIAATVGLGAAVLGQALLALARPIAGAAGAAVLVGLGSGTFVSNLAPVLLGSAPRTHLTRIQSLLSLAQSAALLVSYNVLGTVTRLASARLALLCCSAGLSGCVMLALSSPTLRRLSARAQAGDSIGQTATQVDAGS